MAATIFDLCEPRPDVTAGTASDAVTEADLATPPRPASALTMADLERVNATPALLPPGIEALPLGPCEYAYRMPGADGAVRVSTEPAYFEEHADSVELWSPGSPAFPSIPEPLGGAAATMSPAELLDNMAGSS